MKSIFYLVLSLVVLRMFFPAVSGPLESALLAFLHLANRILSSAGTPTL
jgi:hypothetical protein